MCGTYSKHKFGPELACRTFEDFENPLTFHALLMLFLQHNYIVIAWLQRKGLLIKSLRWERCGVDCNQCTRKKSLDAVAWRCSSRKHEYSIQQFSFFQRSHFSFQVLFQFIKCFWTTKLCWQHLNSVAWTAKRLWVFGPILLQTYSNSGCMTITITFSYPEI